MSNFFIIIDIIIIIIIVMIITIIIIYVAGKTDKVPKYRQSDTRNVTCSSSAAAAA